MRRALIFLLILTIPIGFLLGAHRSIDALQDDVEVGEEYIYGDPGRLAGVSVQLLTTCGDHMWWDTGYTAGEPGVTQTQFHFTQNYHERNEIAFEQEDFAFFAEQVPGVFYRLGCHKAGSKIWPLHNGHFVPDEDAMKVGVQLMVSSAMDYLRK